MSLYIMNVFLITPFIRLSSSSSYTSTAAALPGCGGAATVVAMVIAQTTAEFVVEIMLWIWLL